MASPVYTPIQFFTEWGRYQPAPIREEWDAWLESIVELGIINEAKPTGLIDGGELNIGPGANDIEVIAGVGAVTDSYTTPYSIPVSILVSWPQFNEAITALPAVAGSVVHFTIANVGGDGPLNFTNLGELHQWAGYPGPEVVREEIYLGYAIFNGDTWGEVSTPVVVNVTAHALYDFLNTVAGPTFIMRGGGVSETGTFNLAQASGDFWELNRNWHINKLDPHIEPFAAQSPLPWRYVNAAFDTVTALTTVPDPLLWEDPADWTVKAIGGSSRNCTIQRLYIDPRDNLWVLWGQVIHDNFTEAVARIGVDTASTTIPPELGEGSILLGYIICERTQTAWGAEVARYVSAEVTGGGSGGNAGAIVFTGLTDTPSSYVGEARKMLGVNDAEDALIFESEPTTWRGTWVAAQYYTNDMVYDESYLMIANKDTTDRAAPQPVGDQQWLLSDTPTWDDEVFTGAVWTGLRVKDLVEAFEVSQIRVWIASISPSAHYRVVTVDNISGLTEVGQRFDGSILDAPGWFDAFVTPAFLLPGDDITFFLISENSAGTTDFNHPWVYTGTSQGVADPGTGNCNRDNQQVTLRINDVDDDGTPRDAELDQAMTAGTIIRVAEEADLSAYYEYQVIIGSDEGTWHLYTVALLDTGAGGPPDTLARCQLYFEVPIATPTDYVRIVDHWNTQPQLSGQLKLGTGIVSDNENAYGIDLKVQEYTASEDWDLMSAIGTGGGGGGSAQGLFTDLLDTPSSYIGEAGAVPVVRSTEDGLDFHPYVPIENFFNGTFVESFDARVTSNGTVVTMSLEQSGGGDLTMRFEDGETILDCTPAQTLALTIGTDAVPVANHVYIPASTKVLTISTSEWPTTEHIKVAYIYVQSAADVQNTGPYINQNWNDHRMGTNDQGHLAHLCAAIRLTMDGAFWHDGVDGAVAGEYVEIVSGSPDNIWWKSTSGHCWQMHLHALNAVDTSVTGLIRVMNWDGDPWHETADIADIVEDANGDTLVNRYYSLIFWGVANKTGEYSMLVCNLPEGSYSQEGSAIQDVSGYDVNSIPTEFIQQSTTGFLICRLTFKQSSAGGGSWDLVNTDDYRGLYPGGVSGGGGSSGGGASTFLELLDTPTSYIGEAGKVATVDSGETGLEFTTFPAGVTTWLGLSDTDPTTYVGQANRVVAVNSGEDGLDFTGDRVVTGLLTAGGTTIAGVNIEVNTLGTGDRNAFIDLHSDDTYTDYGGRLIKSSGANGRFDMVARGTGGIRLQVVEAGPIELWTSNTRRMTLTSAGWLGIGIQVPEQKVHVGAGHFQTDNGYGYRCEAPNGLSINLISMANGTYHVTVGASGTQLKLYGSQTRPLYEGDELALLSDLTGESAAPATTDVQIVAGNTGLSWSTKVDVSGIFQLELIKFKNRGYATQSAYARVYIDTVLIFDSPFVSVPNDNDWHALLGPGAAEYIASMFSSSSLKVDVYSSTQNGGCEYSIIYQELEY